MGGYQSIKDKVGGLMSVNIDALVNKALNKSSVAIFDDYLKQMRAELAPLESAEGVERGRLKTLSRKVTALEEECAKLDSEVDKLLQKGERSLAAARQATLNSRKPLLAQYRDNAAEVNAEVERLTEMRIKLSTQIEMTQAKRMELKALLEQRKAAEVRAKAQAGRQIRAPQAARVEDALEKARQEVEVALGKAETSGATLDKQIEDVLGTDELERQLLERESRLAQAAEEEKEYEEAKALWDAVTATPEEIAEALPELAQYTVLEKIGSGGFSDILKAQRKDGLIVALKIPRLTAYQTFVATDFLPEAELWEKLSHPNIVKVYEYAAKPYPWIAIEYMEGGSLRSRIGKLSIAESLQITLNLAQALFYAHHLGVIHRDIKPENILFDLQNTPKLTDWGLGKALLGTQESTDGFKGTLAYCAPEQLSSSEFGEVDWRTDIYQLGAVLCEMLSGQQPAASGDTGTVVTKIMTEEARAPSESNPEVPAELDRIVLTAVSKRKESRYQDVSVFEAELKRLLEGILGTGGLDKERRAVGVTIGVEPPQPPLVAPPEPPPMPPMPPPLASPPATDLRVLLGTTRRSEEVVWAPPSERSWNIIIVGSAGTGKTQAVKATLGEFARQSIPYIVFDFRNDYVPLNSSTSDFGWVLDLGQVSINPLELDGSNSPRDQRFQVSDIIDLLYTIGERQIGYIRDAIRLSYENKGIYEDDESTWVQPPPTFNDIQQSLEDLAEEGTTAEKDSIAGVLARLAPIFDYGVFSATTVMPFEHLMKAHTVVNLGALPSDSLKAIVCEFLLRKLRFYLYSLPESRDPRLYIIVDEAHRLKYEKDSSTGQLLKEARKYGVGVALSTQDPVDFPDLVYNNIGCILSLQLTDPRYARSIAEHLGGTVSWQSVKNGLSEKFSAFVRFSSQPDVIKLRVTPYYERETE